MSIGSFLNVVIYRLPVMLDRQWRSEARAIMHISNAAVQPFNLAHPRSRCPSCGTGIRAWQNIPILSWVLLRGRCGTCRSWISVRYPVVELVAFLVTIPVISMWGYSLAAGFYLVFLWALITLTLIDYDTHLLPDQITLPLLWMGIIGAFAVAESGGFPMPADAVAGAIAGYGSLWTLYWVFKLITGREGMGYGDFKLFGALGAWLGWQALPNVILIASITGLLYAIASMAMGNRGRAQPIPFGPFLSIAGCVTLLLGRDFTLI